ncbi:CDP-diacylglycerol diphosphatase [Methylobacterium haplocladii]|nr:CDP-diacylglycerol diphosphatase [Methylobacterium haplocladii]GJD84443.1 putative CDP-diacylglycerol pyrophosphatase [Methylobacterium haplocladii]
MRAALASLALLVVAGAAAAEVTRDTLWVVTRTCVAAQSTFGKPFPCLRVDLGNAATPGFAVLKAPLLKTEVVVMPIAKIVGLEDMSLRSAAGAAYWRATMGSRHYVTDSLNGRLDLRNVGMAVNSRGGRSQDQLHIHLDCVQPAVRAILRSHAGAFTREWSLLPFPLEHERYYGRMIPETALEDLNPFAALAHLPGSHDLRRTSFALIETSADDPVRGAYLLAYRAADSHAERLLDHDCALAAKTAAR